MNKKLRFQIYTFNLSSVGNSLLILSIFTINGKNTFLLKRGCLLSKLVSIFIIKDSTNSLLGLCKISNEFRTGCPDKLRYLFKVDICVYTSFSNSLASLNDFSIRLFSQSDETGFSSLSTSRSSKILLAFSSL